MSFTWSLVGILFLVGFPVSSVKCLFPSYYNIVSFSIQVCQLFSSLCLKAKIVKLWEIWQNWTKLELAEDDSTLFVVITCVENIS
jgi:hypothetical protein